MKKIMIIFAALGLLVACGGNSEKKQTVEQKAVSYMEQLYNAAVSGNEAKGEKLAEEMEEWGESLSEADQKKAEAAIQEWTMDNMDKLMELEGGF